MSASFDNMKIVDDINWSCFSEMSMTGARVGLRVLSEQETKP